MTTKRTKVCLHGKGPEAFCRDCDGIATKGKQWRLTWAPEGKPLGTVEARTAKAARRKAPLPYRKFLGEIAVEPVLPDGRIANPPEESLVLGQCGECWAINRHEPNCSKASLGDLRRWVD